MFVALVLYAMIMICIDTALRKVEYETKLKDAMKELRELGLEDHQIAEQRMLFEKIDKIGKAAYEAEQAEAMAAMN